MFARSPIPFTCLAVLALGGCDNETPLGPVPLEESVLNPGLAYSAKEEAQPGPKMVPVRWVYHMQAAGADMLWCTAPDGSPVLPVSVNYTGSGWMSHLGKLDSAGTSAQFTECTVAFGTSGPSEATANGVVEVVGANGDSIFLEGSLTLSFASGEAVGNWVITGGIGRFDGAAGWIETVETPAESGDGSTGSGAGMMTPPGAVNH
jgi:hypothetical protein